jgi:peptidylprolyl isomerase
MLPNVTHKVWMKIKIEGINVGQIEFGLFGTNSPAAVEYFLSLVKCHCGATGKLSGKSLCYKGSTIHRVIPNFTVQSGDITHGDGTGGECIHDGRISLKEDQKEKIKFTRPKLLANAGHNMEFGSQFFVTTVKTQWITGRHVAFGRVLNDPGNVITKIEQVGTYGGKTKALVIPELVR